MKKETYQWDIFFSKGDDMHLTENQYAFYKENWREGKVFFDDLEINPSFVTSAQKRLAFELYKMYPCEECGTTGARWSSEKKERYDCPNCDGTGIDTKNRKYSEK